MKLDPTLALAMNMHAGPGVYALLLHALLLQPVAIHLLAH